MVAALEDADHSAEEAGNDASYGVVIDAGNAAGLDDAIEGEKPCKRGGMH